jgi:hypothetical protein
MCPNSKLLVTSSVSPIPTSCFTDRGSNSTPARYDRTEHLADPAGPGSKHSTETQTRSFPRSQKKKAQYRGMSSTAHPARRRRPLSSNIALYKSAFGGSVRDSNTRLNRSRMTSQRGSFTGSSGSVRPRRCRIVRACAEDGPPQQIQQGSTGWRARSPPRPCQLDDNSALDLSPNARTNADQVGKARPVCSPLHTDQALIYAVRPGLSYCISAKPTLDFFALFDRCHAEDRSPH